VGGFGYDAAGNRTSKQQLDYTEDSLSTDIDALRKRRS